jgi:LmbE family N-acetylglucosaminyl deacetylase
VTELLERVCAAPEDPRPAPRVVLVAAHPDDEVVGAGARLCRLRGALVLHVTDGAPEDMRDATALGFATRSDYARARRQELCAALALAGIPAGQARQLGIMDQEAPFRMADLARTLVDVFKDIHPEVVLTHPYEGGHPDHDATAFAVHAACSLSTQRGLAAPAVVEMTSYHNTPTGPSADFLPAADRPITTLRLTKEERAFKRSLFACFRTQHERLRLFPIKVESFRAAPHYDFTEPPHVGTLLYEEWGWNMTGSRWRELARQAIEALRLPVGLTDSFGG